MSGRCRLLSKNNVAELEGAHQAVTGEVQAAFRTVYEENVTIIFGFLRSRVGHEAAEDLTAETFCRAFRHFEAWEDRGLPIRAWLLRIALNLVIARSRRPLAHMVSIDDHPDVTQTPDASTDVEDAMEGASAMAALRQLPRSHQTVIQLRYLQELSVAETAEVMNLTQEAVRALAYRALKGLRAIHQVQWGGTPSPQPDVARGQRDRF